MSKRATKVTMEPVPVKNVLAQIAELRGMDTNALRERWKVLVGGAPPPTRASLLQRLVHRVQEITFGGLSKATQARLDAIADADEGKNTVPDRPLTGTVFVREWRGERHEVTAAADGFDYCGRRYKSLSAVAKAITGQHWSGNLFFGITSRRKGKKK